MCKCAAHHSCLHSSGWASILIAPLRERKSRVAGEKDDYTFISVHQSAPLSPYLTVSPPILFPPSFSHPQPDLCGGGQRIISGVLSEATHISLCFHEALPMLQAHPVGLAALSAGTRDAHSPPVAASPALELQGRSEC